MVISEQELTERVIRNRDMTAFRDLVLQHRKRLYYLIYKTVRNHEDAEDLVQESFIKALRSIDQLKDTSRFGSWISSIAINLAINLKRKKCTKGHISIDSEVPPEVLSDKFVDVRGGERPLLEMRDREISSHLDRELMRLPEKNREAFVMFHINGITVKEIAEIMNCPENTVRSFIFRAVKKLRIQLKPLIN